MKSLLFFTNAEFGGHVHSFLLQESEMMDRSFSEVHVVCRRTKDQVIKDIERNGKVHVHQFGATDLFAGIICYFLQFLSKDNLSDLKLAKNKGLFKEGYLTVSAKQWIIGYAMYSKSKKIIQDDLEQWFVESFWLESGAIAAALLKKRFPGILSVARAHSIEIDPDKNIYCYCEHKEFISKYLDKICFISKAGLDFFRNQIGCCFSVNSELLMLRLGSSKKYPDIKSEHSHNGQFHLLSCSRVEPIKRVELIADALSNMESLDGKITWTHIGAGSCFEKLRMRIAAMRINENIEIKLLGDLAPEEVQDYYKEKPIDCLINVSLSEGLPVSIMEAHSYGVPVIATNVGGTGEIVNNSNGVIIPADITADALAKVIQDLIQIKNKNEHEYQNLCQAAYESWDREFNIDNCFPAFLKALGIRETSVKCRKQEME